MRVPLARRPVYVTEGRWHDTRSATTAERDSLCCSLCEELLE
jgi:hypothetical protein